MAATSGFLQNSNLLKTSFKPIPSELAPNSDISAPAMNARPFPVRTTPTIDSSSSALVIDS